MVSLIVFIIFIYSIILHEITHGWVAERLGDPTARISGRLTLKPGPHIDPFMSIFFPLFLILTNFPIVVGSAKPIPIDPYNLRRPRKDMGVIGLAGPASNLLLAFLFAGVARISLIFLPSPTLFQILLNASQINVVLAVFNLTPLPPLDGGRVLVAILPEKYADALASIENFGLFIILFLLLFPTPLFSLQNIVFKISNLILSLIFPNFPIV